MMRWRAQATKMGRKITRIAVAFEAGRDGFWLARWLLAKGLPCRQLVLGKELGDLAASCQQQQVGRDQNAIGPRIVELLQGDFDLGNAVDLENIEVDAQLL